MSDYGIEEVVEGCEAHMDNAIEALKKDYSGIRTGKASPAMVESIMVEYYGAQSRLKDIASVTAPEPRLLAIQPWDQSAVKDIERAIINSDLGISPVTDGRIIRLPVPELSEERRRDMVKLVGQRSEQGKVEVRNVRREANDIIKKALKNSDITEDESRDLQDEVQKLTDSYVKKVDELQAEKEQDLMKHLTAAKQVVT